MSDDKESTQAPTWSKMADRDLDEQFARYQGVREEIQILSASATSPDRSVRVTVGPGGAVQDINFQQQALRLGPDRLARTLIAAIRQATVEVNQKMAELVQPLAPQGVDVISMVGAHLPEAEADDPEEYLRKKGIRW